MKTQQRQMAVAGLGRALNQLDGLNRLSEFNRSCSLTRVVCAAALAALLIIGSGANARADLCSSNHWSAT